jgi:hypothetical protein
MAAEARSNFMFKHSLVRIVMCDPLAENLHPHVAGRAEENAPGDEKIEQ